MMFVEDFGEMLTWWSIYAATLPTLLSISPAAAVLGVLSPSFVTFLLLKVSGIPLSERNNQKKYKGRADFQRYVESTPLLLPWPPMLRSQAKSKDN
ncbi:DUF1295 domain-containing protein [archaeon]|nr:MAG: DUF1295 domain-containing protein [archaeon]